MALQCLRWMLHRPGLVAPRIEVSFCEGGTAEPVRITVEPEEGVYEAARGMKARFLHAFLLLL